MLIADESLFLKRTSQMFRDHKRRAPDGYEVNHKDGNPANYSLDNLEIGTRQHNVDHAWETGLTNNHGERCSFARLSEPTVKEIRRRHDAGELGSLAAAAREYGVSPQTIARIIKRRTWKTS